MAKQVMPKKAAAPSAPAAKKAPSGAVDMRSQLKGMAGTWSATPTPEGGAFGNIPDGKYKAQIDNPVLRNGGKNKDQLQINWPCRIIGPTHENRLAFANTGLTTEQGIGIAKGYLDILGLTVPDSIEELPETLAAAHGKVVEITLRTKAAADGNKYQNCYINGLIEEEGTEAATEAAVEPAVEETPSFVGSNVSFELDGNTVTGEVKAQDGETLTVDVLGTEYEVPMSLVSLAETEPEPEAEPAADEDAKHVKFSLEDGSEVVAQVLEVTADGNLKCVDAEGTEYEVPASEAVDVSAEGAEEGVEEAEVAPPPAPKKPAVKAKTPPPAAKPAPQVKKPAAAVAKKPAPAVAKKPAKK